MQNVVYIYWHIEKYSLKIVGKDGLSVTVNGDDVGLAVEYEKNLEDDFEEHKSSRSFFGFLSNHDHNLEADASYNQEALNSIINKLLKSNAVLSIYKLFPSIYRLSKVYW